MKHIKLAVAGTGVVGANVIESIKNKKAYFANRFDVDIEIVGISSRTKKDLPFRWYENALDMIDKEQPDIVCELIGGDSGIADDIAVKSLTESRTLITANKALLAKKGADLLELAQTKNTKLFFEAAVGGAVPIIQIISTNLNYNEINGYQGILNGTANYILTVMHNEKKDLDSVISKAQELGLAESDPTFDICGIDAGQKLAIMNSLIYNVGFDAKDVKIEGIDKITLEDIRAAEKIDAKIKLVAQSLVYEDILNSRVSPVFCRQSNFLYSIDYAMNAVNFKTDMATDMSLVSHGAGGIQTAHAVLSDIQACIANQNSPKCNDYQKINEYRNLEYTGHIILKTPSLIEDALGLEPFILIPIIIIYLKILMKVF